MVKIAAIGVIAAMLALQFKSEKAEYGIYISLAACMLIFGMGVSKLEIIMNTLEKIQSYLGIHKMYFDILVKIIGITYLSELASSLCKDAGHGAIANQIELVGKLTVLSISMPILMALLDTINDFLA